MCVFSHVICLKNVGFLNGFDGGMGVVGWFVGLLSKQAVDFTERWGAVGMVWFLGLVERVWRNVWCFFVFFFSDELSEKCL